MIVKTRYRDISFEEATKCCTKAGLRLVRREDWEAVRGQPLEIITPPVKERQWKYIKCGAPFYRTAHCDDDSKGVCEHVAEIGD